MKSLSGMASGQPHSVREVHAHSSNREQIIRSCLPIAVTVLLMIFVGGFPPTTWVLLIQTFEQLNALLVSEGPRVILALIILIVQSLFLVGAWLLLGWVILREGAYLMTMQSKAELDRLLAFQSASGELINLSQMVTRQSPLEQDFDEEKDTSKEDQDEDNSDNNDGDDDTMESSLEEEESEEDSWVSSSIQSRNVRSRNTSSRGVESKSANVRSRNTSSRGVESKSANVQSRGISTRGVESKSVHVQSRGMSTRGVESRSTNVQSRGTSSRSGESKSANVQSRSTSSRTGESKSANVQSRGTSSRSVESSRAHVQSRGMPSRSVESRTVQSSRVEPDNVQSHNLKSRNLRSHHTLSSRRSGLSAGRLPEEELLENPFEKGLPSTPQIDDNMKQNRMKMAAKQEEPLEEENGEDDDDNPFVYGNPFDGPLPEVFKYDTELRRSVQELKEEEASRSNGSKARESVAQQAKRS